MALQATLFANLVTNDPDLKDAVVTSASTIDAVNNRLFAVLLSPTYGWAHFATLNLVAKTQTNWNISIKGDYVYLESFFNALWVPSENKVSSRVGSRVVPIVKRRCSCARAWSLNVYEITMTLTCLAVSVVRSYFSSQGTGISSSGLTRPTVQRRP